MNPSSSRRDSRGGALLAVLWLSAALTAVAFTVALNVRGEIGRTETSLEGLRARYLATGSVERAINYMKYFVDGNAQLMPDGRARYWVPGQPLMYMRYPEGEALVEVIPESSRLNVNYAPIEEISRLLLALGASPVQAATVANGILDWRSPGGTGLDGIYLARRPSFRAPHASMQQIEELLSVQGMTPELFYGRYDKALDGTVVARPGLKDCLSVYSSSDGFDINTTEPEVMVAVGVPPEIAFPFAAMRRRQPVTKESFPAAQATMGGASSRFVLGTNGRIYTVRATARPRRPDGMLSDLRRSASATVQLFSKTSPEAFRVLQAKDNASGDRMLFDVWPQ